jgi:hypothetical protein
MTGISAAGVGHWRTQRQALPITRPKNLLYRHQAGFRLLWQPRS